jgi:sialic acid synthase SpsE
VGESKWRNKLRLTVSKKIYNFSKPYIIAELGSNHNGDMDLARELIVQAKEAGADCVKFQSWSKDSIFSKEKYDDNYFIADDYRGREDYTLETIVEEYSISEQELLEMKEFSDQIGIDCTSTPFSKKEADFLVDKMQTPFIKVASMDLNNYPFLEYLAKKGKPMIISTGLSELHEIDRAIKTIEGASNSQITILHCVATYPPIDSDVNLNNIKTLMSTYPEYPIGFSDHTLGTVVPLAAVALGACLIEKHFTLDKEMKGWDHKVSATKDEMKVIVKGSKRIVEVMGSFRISATESNEKKKEFRRSIVITRDMKKGDVIEAEDLDYKRPGGNLNPEMTNFIIGRTINKDIKNDHILTKKDIV